MIKGNYDRNIILNVLFLGLDAYIISLTTEATHYFIREFLYGLLFVGIVAAFVFGFTSISKMKWFQNKWVPCILLVVFFVVGVCITLEITPFNAINTPFDASTHAVEGRSFGLYAINKADKGVPHIVNI